MSFQSAHFLLFLLVVGTACLVLRHHFSARKNMLLVASYYFYMCWDWRFGLLLAASSVLHFVVARRLAGESRPAQRRMWLAVSVLVGLGALAYFKYANFFLQSAAALALRLGWSPNMALLQVVLPVGISFYTFQALSYVLDVYRGQETPTQSLRDFALFVAFFPTVLAGPITRANLLLRQLSSPVELPRAELEQAAGLVALGFVKKIVFADVLATQLVAPAFDDPAGQSPLMLWLALYAFTFQIYMDVSGYTDIARGAGLLCGFRLPQNFDRPYLATTVSNFWQRWHMSMSSFFRDYVFIPLGGSRRGNVYLNLMVTFLAIGLWHGGGWNFILYGALHGSAVCVERWIRLRRSGAQARPDGRVPDWAVTLSRRVLTFHFVVLTRVLFRAADLAHAGTYVKALLGTSARMQQIPWMALGLMLVAAVLHWSWPNARGWTLERFRRLPIMVQGLALAGVAWICVAFSQGSAGFVYFIF